MPWSKNPDLDTEEPVRSLGMVLRELVDAGKLPPPEPPTLADFLGPDADTCAACRGMRVVRRDLPIDHPDFGKAIPCPACAAPLLQQRRLDRLFGQLPPAFRDLTLDACDAWIGERLAEGHPFEPADLVERLRAWQRAEPRPWLWLWGPVGLCKTSLCIALLRAEIEAGRTAIYRTVPRLLDRLKQTFDSRGDDDSYEAVLRELVEVDRLFLDDLGKEHATPWSRQVLFELIDERSKHPERVTLVTSNLAPWDLAAHLDDAAVPDRIRGRTGGDAFTIELRGESVRGIARAA